MTSSDLSLVELAVKQGLIPSDALDRARRDCRGRADEWLLAERLVTRDQLRDLLEDGLPPLPRAAGHDSSWAVLVFVFVIVGAAIAGLAFFWGAQRPPPMPPPPFATAPYLRSADPLADATDAFHRGDLPLAIARSTEGLAVKPGDPALLTLRGKARHRLCEFPAALADAEEALRSDPAHEPAVLLRATCLHDTGRLPEAISELEKLPSSPDRDLLLQSLRTRAAEKR